jgi:tRNA threonylcarbamoyladenosine biosynthesis protein TsaB
MKVLGLEASTDFASVALWEDGSLVFEERFESKRSLSADLFPVLWRLLEPVGAVDRIAVGLGPGSYAGVRITIAAALGLQCIWGCEIRGIPSVAVLGAQGESYQAIGDARRGTWTRRLRTVCVWMVLCCWNLRKCSREPWRRAMDWFGRLKFFRTNGERL